MKRYISSSRSGVDLSEEISIGKQCINELRKLFPDIPRRVSYKRGSAWSDCWYIDFYLQIPVDKMAEEYQKEHESQDYKAYWDYIHDFEDRCNKVTNLPKFNNDFVRCNVLYSDMTSKDYLEHHGSDSAILQVFALTKPSR